jgi:hypothetical protein
MDLQQTLKALEHNNQHYAREAVSEAILRRDEIIPALLKILEDVIEHPESFVDSQRFDHIYAMFLLAQFRETRAYPLLVKMFSAPGEFAFDLVGDTVTEHLGQILASVSGGDIGGMAALVENEDANEYVRAAGLTGLLTLCACDILSRDELMSYFKSLFQKLRRTPDGIWSWLANSCADLCPEEVLEELGQAYEEGLPDPGVIGWGEVEEALAMGKEAAMARLRRSRYSLLSDVHKEMSWWASFRENQRPPVRDDLFLPAEYEVVDPIHRTEPKVGRNDPCPCGSGKKYKKCCGR